MVLRLLTDAGRRRLALLGVASLLAALLEVTTVAGVTAWLALLSSPQALADPLPLGFGVLVLIGLDHLVQATVRRKGVELSHREEQALTARLLEACLRRPYLRSVMESSTTLRGHVLDGRLGIGLLAPLFLVVNRGTMAVVLFLLLAVVNLPVALVATAFLGTAYLALTRMTRRSLGNLAVEVREAEVRAARHAEEALAGFQALRVLGREGAVLDAYRRESAKVAAGRAALTFSAEAPRYALEAAAMAGLVGLALTLLLQGHSSSDLLPMLGLYALAGYRMIPAFNSCFSNVAALRFHAPHLRECLAILEQDREPPEGDLPPIELRHGLRLPDVTFTYPGASRPALSDVTLEVPRGCTLALVGPSGAGKTTLANLLIGLWEGGLEVDGVPLAGPALSAWRRRVGYLPQRVYVADGTVLDNVCLAMAAEERDEGAAREAARLACLDVDLSTRVGENGVRLSGGQRLRLGLARALYGDPDLLVLDEPTASVDTVTETALLEALRSLAGRTLVLIAHRPSTIRACDRVCVLQEGRVVAQGPLEEVEGESGLLRGLLGV